MVGRRMPNSSHGRPPGTRVMTIFVFYVNPQIPDIEYFEANEVYKSREVSHLFSHQISSRVVSVHVWGPIFDSSYDHFYKCDHFGNKCITYIYIYMREGKKGREKGKGKREEKKGREKGKGKREGKREGKKGKWFNSLEGAQES